MSTLNYTFLVGFTLLFIFNLNCTSLSEKWVIDISVYYQRDVNHSLENFL